MNKLCRLIFPLFTALSTAALIAQPSWINDGLVAYYPFNGDARDVSGNQKNWTPVNVLPTFDRFGKESAGYDFISTNSSHIVLPEIDAEIGAPRSSFTITAWVVSNERVKENVTLAATDLNPYQMPRIEISENRTILYYNRAGGERNLKNRDS